MLRRIFLYLEHNDIHERSLTPMEHDRDCVYLFDWSSEFVGQVKSEEFPLARSLFAGVLASSVKLQEHPELIMKANAMSSNTLATSFV